MNDDNYFQSQIDEVNKSFKIKISNLKYSQELILNLKLSPKDESDIENIAKQLSNLEFFSYYYSQNKFHTLIKDCILNSQYKFIKAGQYIFKQGDLSDLFYILIDGIVQKQILTYKIQTQTNESPATNKNIPSRKKVKSLAKDDEKSIINLRKYYQGDSFGEFQMQNKELRKYYAKCLTDTHLLAISKESYFSLLAYQEKKRLINVVEQLKQIPYFNNWTLTEIKKLYNHIEIKNFSINSFVFQEEDPSDYFYIVKQGEFMILLLSKMQTIGEAEILNNLKGMQYSLVCITSIGQLYQLKKQDFIDHVLSDELSKQKVETKVMLQKEEIEKIMININQSYNAYKDFIFKDETIEENLRREDQYKQLSVSSNKWKTITDLQNVNQGGQTHDKKTSTFKDYFKMSLHNTDSNFIQTPRDESKQKLNGRSNFMLETPKKVQSAQQSRVFDNSHISSHQSLIEQQNEQDSQLVENYMSHKQGFKLTHRSPQSHNTTPKTSTFQNNYFINSPQSSSVMKQQIDLKTSQSNYLKNYVGNNIKNSLFNQFNQTNTQKNEGNNKNITFSSLINESKNYLVNTLVMEQPHLNNFNSIEQNIANNQPYYKNFQYSHNSSLVDFQMDEQEVKHQKIKKSQSHKIILAHQQTQQQHQQQQTQLQKSQSQIQFQSNNIQQNKKQIDQEQKNHDQILQPQMKRAQSACHKKVKITQVENNLHNRLRFKFYQRIKDQDRNPEGMKLHIFEDVIQKMPYKKTPHLKLRPYEIMNKASDAFDKTKYIKQEIQHQKTQSMQEFNTFLHYPISVRTQTTFQTQQQPYTKLTTTDTHQSYAPNDNKIKRKRPVSMCNLTKVHIENKEEFPQHVERLQSSKGQNSKVSSSVSIKTFQNTQENQKLNTNMNTIYGSQQFTNYTQEFDKLNTEYQQQNTQQVQAQNQPNDYIFKFFMPTSKRTHFNEEGYKFSQVQSTQKKKNASSINISLPDKDNLFISQTKSTKNIDFKPCIIDDYSKPFKQISSNQNILKNQLLQKSLKQNLAIHSIQSKLDTYMRHPLSTPSKNVHWQIRLTTHKKLDSSAIKSINQTQYNFI